MCLVYGSLMAVNVHYAENRNNYWPPPPPPRKTNDCCLSAHSCINVKENCQKYICFYLNSIITSFICRNCNFLTRFKNYPKFRANVILSWILTKRFIWRIVIIYYTFSHFKNYQSQFDVITCFNYSQQLIENIVFFYIYRLEKTTWFFWSQ